MSNCFLPITTRFYCHRHRYIRRNDKKAQNLNLPNATFLVEDILNFKSKEKYDAVIAFDSIWHIAHDNQKKSIQLYPL